MAKKARKKNSRLPVDKISENQPPDRFAALEQRVARLEDDVALLRMASPLPLFANESDELEEKRKRGPKEKVREHVLLYSRDELVLWLEKYWSWLEERLRKASTSDEVRAFLEVIAEEPTRRPQWQDRLLKSAPVLHEFLASERFPKRPLGRATVSDALNMDIDAERRRRAANQLPSRQIANAMAGVCEISWRTSLDRCSAQPSNHYVAINLDMFYRFEYGIAWAKGRSFIGASSPLPRFP